MSSHKQSSPQSLSEEQQRKAVEKAKRKAEHEAKRAAELQSKTQTGDATTAQSKADLRKVRREQQEQQRAAKSKSQPQQVKEKTSSQPSATPSTPKTDATKATVKETLPAEETSTGNISKKIEKMSIREDEKSNLFPQIPIGCQNIDELTKVLGVKGQLIHPVIIKAGVRMNLKTICGTAPRTLALMIGLKALITDYCTPTGEAMDRHLPLLIDKSMDFMNRCRRLTTGMANGAAYIRRLVTRLPVDQEEQRSKEYLIRQIDEYIEDEICCAIRSITQEANSLIKDKDVILTFGCSLTIKHVLYAAVLSGKKFKVVVVDCGPDYRGLEMVTFLSEISEDLDIRYVYMNSMTHIMNEVSKILVGGHGVLANGYVIASMGCSQVALVAKAYNVPFIVCCETNEFADAVHTDAFVFNETGMVQEYLNPKNEKLIRFFESEKDDKKKQNLNFLNLFYDATPPEYVSMIVTEKGIFPCHAVPAIIRRNYNRLQ